MAHFPNNSYPTGYGEKEDDEPDHSSQFSPPTPYVTGGYDPSGGFYGGSYGGSYHGPSTLESYSMSPSGVPPEDPSAPHEFGGGHLAASPGGLTQGLQHLNIDPPQQSAQSLHPNGPGSVSGISVFSSIDYPLRNPQNVSNLDFTFQMRRDPRIFFVVGTVFNCLWTEPVGETTADTSGYQFTQNWLGGWMYSNTQRFVVVRPRHDQKLSFCLPIKTYGHKGTSKVQSGHHAHAIIYTGPVPPMRLALEDEFSKMPICMEGIDRTEILAPESRLNFGKPTPVEHNLRVKYIGRIRSDLHRLVRYYDQENNSAPIEPGPRRSSERRYSNSGYSTEVSRSIPRVDEHLESQSLPRPGTNMIQGYPQDLMTMNRPPPQIQQNFRADVDVGRERANTSPAPISRTVVKEQRPQTHNRGLTDTALQDHKYDKDDKYDKYDKKPGRRRH